MGLTDSDGNHRLVDPDGKEEGGGHHSDAIQQLVLYLLLILDLRGWDCVGGVYTAAAFIQEPFMQQLWKVSGRLY